MTTADRPTTEPRTEAADPYKNRHPVRQWRLTDKVRQELDQIRSAGLSYDGVVADFDHAIRQERAEAAQGAAPRAEGLDVEAFVSALHAEAARYGWHRIDTVKVRHILRRMTDPLICYCGHRHTADSNREDAGCPCNDAHEGAAPRAEGLDVETLRDEGRQETLREIRARIDRAIAVKPYWGYYRDRFIAILDEVARFSRPSDERVPEPTGEIATVESALRGADEFGRVIREADDVWRQLEEQPGFSDELRQAEKDIAEGRGTPFRDIRRVPESEER